MRSIVTWVVLANPKMIRVVADRGCGKGLVALGGKCWRAKDFVRKIDHAEGAKGASHVCEINKERNIEMSLAANVAEHLRIAHAHWDFDRLALLAESHMLTLLRSKLDDHLRSALVGEIAEDFSHQPLEIVEMRLQKILAA